MSSSSLLTKRAPVESDGCDGPDSIGGARKGKARGAEINLTPSLQLKLHRSDVVEGTGKTNFQLPREATREVTPGGEHTLQWA